MKIVKLKLTNFSSYYGEANEIVLFDNNRMDKNVTLNIGPTGTGKTSISNSIMWCLFGEIFVRSWGPIVNDYAIEIAMQIRKKIVKMAVEMEVEIEGETYLILRTGNYDYKAEIVEKTKISVRTHGETEKKPMDFINKHFHPRNLMEYFIFDADDMVSLFEKNREKTIKDLINKIVGVKTIDDMAETLKYVKKLCEEEIRQIRVTSPGVPTQAVENEEAKIKLKEDAIKVLEGDIKGLEEKKTQLLPKGRLSPDDETLKEIMDNENQAKESIKRLNKHFEEDSTLIQDFYLLFLKEIIDKSVESLNAKNTTKAEFDSAIDILKSTLEGKYSGILIDEGQTQLLRRGISIKDRELENLGEITLEEGSGMKSRMLHELNKAGDDWQNTSENFNARYSDYMDAQRESDTARNLLRQLGKTEENKQRKVKIEEFLGIDQKTQEIRDVIEETETELAKIEKIKDELEKGGKIDKANQIKIEKITKDIEKIDTMKIIVNKSKKVFLSKLLEAVNADASEFFRSVRKRDETRLHSLVIDSDYMLYIKNASNEIINLKTINKGNMQIALMAFFFGLSKFLKFTLPYVIDDPSIRLDPGHDRRLLQHLCNSEQQIIMHMIPGREYTEHSYGWLEPYINTQNWINKKKDARSDHMCSSVQKMDPNKFVEFDIDTL